jgi:hypothetical protein
MKFRLFTGRCRRCRCAIDFHRALPGFSPINNIDGESFPVHGKVAGNLCRDKKNLCRDGLHLYRDETCLYRDETCLYRDETCLYRDNSSISVEIEVISTEMKVISTEMKSISTEIFFISTEIFSPFYRKTNNSKFRTPDLDGNIIQSIK